MKKSFLVTLFLGLILVLAACGGDAGDNDQNDKADQSTENSSEDVSENSTVSNSFDIIAKNWDFDQDE